MSLFLKSCVIGESSFCLFVFCDGTLFVVKCVLRSCKGELTKGGLKKKRVLGF